MNTRKPLVWLSSVMFIAGSAVLAARPAHAQQPRAESLEEVVITGSRIRQNPLEERLPVMSLEDVLATKLLALSEQEPNYGAVLEIARTEGGTLVRERQQVGQAQLDALRGDLASRFAAQGRTRAVDRSGRSGLVLMESMHGSVSAITSIFFGGQNAPRMSRCVWNIGRRNCTNTSRHRRLHIETCAALTRLSSR